jgi:hypothetical protein
MGLQTRPLQRSHSHHLHAHRVHGAQQGGGLCRAGQGYILRAAGQTEGSPSSGDCDVETAPVAGCMRQTPALLEFKLFCRPSVYGKSGKLFQPNRVKLTYPGDNSK